MTVSEISDKLNLAISTASQHIADLKEAGAIIEIELGHAKKWRYYRLNPDFQLNKEIEKNNANDKAIIFGTAAVIGIVAISLYLFSVYGGQSSNALLFSLTDPPIVPNGTQSLFINYSSLEIHITAQNGSSMWIPGKGNGTIDLLTLVNASQIIGLARIPKNMSVDAVRFNVDSARIMINGTEYNVSIPNSQVSTQISPPASNSEEVLIDLFPTVGVVYNHNTVNFSLLLTMKAITQPKTFDYPEPGIRMMLNQNEISGFTGTAAGISLRNVTIKQGNNSVVSLEILNNLNTGIIIRNVLVVGKLNLNNQWEAPQGFSGPNNLRMLNFIVNGNGTLTIQHLFMQELNSGYILEPKKSIVLNFTGNITFDNGVSVTFVPNSTYKVVVIGDRDTYATFQVKTR